MAENKILECSKMLAERKLTIAFAESATAGWLCSEFALAPESGKVLLGGLVCYDASLKEKLLGVPVEIIEKYTPESMEVTDELAKRLASVIESDIQVAVTGLTTSGGSETAEKPVGTIFISALISGKAAHTRHVFNGSCEQIIHHAVQAAADLLITELRLGDEQNNPPLSEQADKAVDKAGVGQTDEDKGIAPKDVRERKRKELEEEGKARRRPIFNGDNDTQPLQLE